MAKTIADFTKSAKSRGMSVGKKFSGTVRDINFSGFAEGDKLIIPSEFEVFEQTFGRGENASKAEFIYVEVTEKSGQVKVKQLFPSTFTKTVQEYKKTAPGKILEPLDAEPRYTLGSAAEKFREFVDVQEAMEAIADKPLVISKVESVTSKRYGRDELYNAQLLTIDFAQ